MMNNFQVDFTRDGGTYMILRADEVADTSINHVQKEMLNFIEVPGLLRLDLRTVNNKVSLHYDITGKRMLSQYTRHASFTMTEYYSLFMQLITILDDSKEYMLSQSNYLLNEDFIFVEESSSGIILFLVYTPLKNDLNQNMNEPIHQAILSLLTKLMSHISHLEGTGIQKLISLCNEESFSSSQFKKLLLELLADDKSAIGGISSAAISGISSNSISGMVEALVRREPPAHSPLIKEYVPINSGVPVIKRRSEAQSNTTNRGASAAARIGIREDVLQEEFEDGQDNKRASSSKMTHYTLGGLLLLAFSWKFIYIDDPELWKLYICVVLSGIIVVLLLLIRSGKLNLFGYKKVGYEHEEDNENDVEDDTANSNGMNLHNIWAKTTRKKSYDEDWRWNTPENNNVVRDAQVQSILDRVLPLEGQYSARQDKLDADMDQGTALGGDINRDDTYPDDTYRDALSDRGVAVGAGLSSGSGANPVTTLLNQSMLREGYDSNGSGGSNNNRLESARAGYLERHHSSGGESMRIPLSFGSFVIGRSEEMVQHVEQGFGVSRAHVELMITNGGCRLKDLASRNGTQLNGEMMAPYKEYPLTSGDVFSFSDVSFTYCR